MPFNKTDESEGTDWKYRKPVGKILSEYELRELDKELQEFRVESSVMYPFPRTVSWIDTEAWMRSKGAMGKNGVAISDFRWVKAVRKGQDTAVPDCQPILMEELETKLEQWSKWTCRNEYAEDKRMEGYEELAKGMRI